MDKNSHQQYGLLITFHHYCRKLKFAFKKWFDLRILFLAVYNQICYIILGPLTWLNLLMYFWAVQIISFLSTVSLTLSSCHDAVLPYLLQLPVATMNSDWRWLCSKCLKFCYCLMFLFLCIFLPITYTVKEENNPKINNKWLILFPSFIFHYLSYLI